VSTAGGSATSATAFVVTGPPALQLISRQPLAQATAAPVGGAVALTFSQAVSSATAGQLRVWGSQRSGRQAGPPTGGGSATLRLAPAPRFAPSEVVSVSVPATVQSPAGASARPVVYQFRAAAGRATAQFTTTFPLPLISQPRRTTLGDVDNDGDLDVLVGAYDGVNLCRNNGPTTFGPATLLNVRQEYDSSGRPLLADIDNDGDLDLLSANTYGAAIRRNDGSGNFTGTESLEFPGTNEMQVGDVDADGDLDLLTANADANSVSIRLNDGLGRFAVATL